jgi:hypothetical protein
MKFYKLTEVPARSDDLVFKASPIGNFIPFIVFAGIVGALILFETQRAANVFVYCWTAVFGGLFVLLSFGQFRASLQPANWLLRCHGSGVIIKYRSYLNWRFPAEDVQAVGFDYAEIAWARTVQEQRASPNTRGKKLSQSFTYLDLGLANADTSALETHLRAEQKIPSNKHWLAIDYPVEVLPGGILQLHWNGISPPAAKAIHSLSRFVKIAAADSTKIDLTHQSNLAPATEDAKILALVKSGDKMGAVTLTRQIYGSTLTEAVAYVEKLQS